MNPQNLDALGNQMISNEVAIISMLQVLAQAQPDLGQALANAMRENSSRVPRGFQGVRDRVEQYLEVIANRSAA